MKTKIDVDDLVRSIKYYRSQLTHAAPGVLANLLADSLLAHKADPLSAAIQTREFIKSWVEDMSIPLDVRNYAQQQLDALPAFE